MFTLESLLLLCLIAGIVGMIAKSIVGTSNGGCLVSIAIGLAGALIGTYLAKAVNLPDILPIRIGGTHFPLVWSIIGAVVFVTVVSLFTRNWK